MVFKVSGTVDPLMKMSALIISGLAERCSPLHQHQVHVQYLNCQIKYQLCSGICSTPGPASTGMGDRIHVQFKLQFISASNQPPRSTQPGYPSCRPDAHLPIIIIIIIREVLSPALHTCPGMHYRQVNEAKVLYQTGVF